MKVLLICFVNMIFSINHLKYEILILWINYLDCLKLKLEMEHPWVMIDWEMFMKHIKISIRISKGWIFVSSIFISILCKVWSCLSYSPIIKYRLQYRLNKVNFLKFNFVVLLLHMQLYNIISFLKTLTHLPNL